MEVFVSQAQRNLIFLPGRTCFFSGYRAPLRKQSSCRIARLHGSIWFQNEVDHENGHLTLSSIGFGNKIGIMNKFTRRKPEHLTSVSQVRSSKANIVKLEKQVGHGIRDARVAKKDKTERIREQDSARDLSLIQAEPVKNNELKENSTRRVIDIDPSLFSANSFSELNLSPLLTKRMHEEGITIPTDVQSTAIRTISRNRDVVIQSYTGSGKTFAYLLPILSEVGPLKNTMDSEKSENKQGIEAVIVAPSRELGMQIVREVEKLLGIQCKKFVQQLVGGANRSRQEEALKKNKPGIVVGTPGRIAEISAAGKLHTHGCRFLVVDEVDQLLSFNFREDMHRILEHVGRRAGAQPNNCHGMSSRRTERQLIMVSATVPFSVLRAARSWGTDPLLVKAKSVTPLESLSAPLRTSSVSEPSSSSHSSALTQAPLDSLPPSLQHYYCVTKSQHKVDTLRRCVHALDARSVIAFMNHTKQLKDVVFKLEARGMKSAALHGDLGKLGRSTTLKNFKNGDLRVLVTNELSARGLDVFDCDLVVNLDLPTDSVHYAHRAGRTGRLGKKGNVVTIIEKPEVFVVNKLRRQLGVAIQACEFTEGKLILVEEEEEKAMG